MPTTTDAPKVFISYSWNPPQHKERVIELAKRLSNDGVHVILDVWDLAPGQDKHSFMEQTVTNPDIKKVLLICNKSYKDKADGRQGGVGTESLIMSKEVYAKADQTKFIPLVFEADEQGEPCVPTFIHSRIFFDLRETEEYEDNYEQLIRNIFDKPIHARPPLGMRPSYLEVETPSTLPTAHRVAAIKRAFLDERRNAPLLVKQYYNAFLEALKGFEPQPEEFTADNFIELTLNKIEQSKPLRDDFVLFLDTYLDTAPEFDQEALQDFLAELVLYLNAKAIQGFNQDRINSLQFDYLRFFVYELFLYFIAILLKREKFQILAGILNDSFVVIQEQERADARVEDFRVFSSYNATLNKHQNEKFKMNRVSVVGDNINKRASNRYTFDELKQADIILHHLSELEGFIPLASSRRLWRPETAAYNTYTLPIFAKMVSLRYFDKIKVLFNVQTKEELVNLIRTIESDHHVQLWHRSDYYMNREIPLLSRAIDLDKIATLK
ncbi:SEFIR domain protein [Hymenobacter roseosalivarius DSM 11622]|uniref:SEFIR domain protein n=1 Tax=Hymenobacter roseosalivarius DSM 11622 TaxID=645990 RepID=A0A1W1UJY1_9BACT|nr:toll/interleukin-1 receptor domain-containing protein [Hymenobacter roseosalivarius]SMB81390.1 SEFIR domain protein [Hymenobacter roseosalivarius DSM 11622]